eukprot:554889-Hanusia_phi.AAC.18
MMFTRRISPPRKRPSSSSTPRAIQAAPVPRPGETQRSPPCPTLGAATGCCLCTADSDAAIRLDALALACWMLCRDPFRPTRRVLMIYGRGGEASSTCSDLRCAQVDVPGGKPAGSIASSIHLDSINLYLYIFVSRVNAVLSAC